MKTICQLCHGKGSVRSGQWGGFEDTCIRCHGTGMIDEDQKANDEHKFNVAYMVFLIFFVLGLTISGAGSAEAGGTLMAIGLVLAVICYAAAGK